MGSEPSRNDTVMQGVTLPKGAARTGEPQHNATSTKREELPGTVCSVYTKISEYTQYSVQYIPVE